MSASAIALISSLLGAAIPIWWWNLNDIFDWSGKLYIRRLKKKENK